MNLTETRTSESRLMAEIRDANLSYLMLAQAMLREDRERALFRLGVTPEVADIICALSPAQMLKIAAGNLLMCRFRFDDEMVWSLLTEHARPEMDGGERSATRLHASILMAGRFAEAA